MNQKAPITKIRVKAGLTQAELAKLVGVSENTMANWEKGETLTNWVRHLRKICRVLGCTLEELDSEQQASDMGMGFQDLTLYVLETVRSYCQALSDKNNRAAAKISSFAILHDNPLHYWLNQADHVVRQSQERLDSHVDCEVVINTLVLQNLSMQLSSIPPTQVTLEKFRELVKATKLSPDFLSRYISFNENHLSRKLILQTRYLCVYVIGWKPDQISFLHHHGNSLDAIRVIKGKMNHWVLSPKEYVAPFEGCATAQKYTGSPPDVGSEGKLVFVDRRYSHQIENSSRENLVTLNIRFGAPPDDDYWEPTKEQPMVIWHQPEEYQVMST